LQAQTAVCPEKDALPVQSESEPQQADYFSSAVVMGSVFGALKLQ